MAAKLDKHTIDTEIKLLRYLISIFSILGSRFRLAATTPKIFALCRA